MNTKVLVPDRLLPYGVCTALEVHINLRVETGCKDSTLILFISYDYSSVLFFLCILIKDVKCLISLILIVLSFFISL